jgi:hypothetical protein
LHARIEELEHMEHEHKKIQRQLDAYKEMMGNTLGYAHCLKDEPSKQESTLQWKYRIARSLSVVGSLLLLVSRKPT